MALKAAEKRKCGAEMQFLHYSTSAKQKWDIKTICQEAKQLTDSPLISMKIKSEIVFMSRQKWLCEW